MRTRTPLTIAALCALTASSFLTAAALPGQADEPLEYVALGDSFSSGTGTRASTDADCYRSQYGYPALLAQAHGLQLDYQACSGAVVADVHRNQLAALSDSTDLVTMTIGGNDVGFASVITQCALPGWLSNCQGRINQAREVLNNEMPARYDALFAEVGLRAPSADVVIGNYPHLFNGRNCNLATFFSAAEMRELNAATDELASLIEARTSAAGFRYVDARPAFQGHAVCDSPEWINGLSMPITESYHPNRAGNVGYADVFWPGTSAAGSAGSMGTQSLDIQQESETFSHAEQVRAQADAVLEMDLTSTENLARARAEGVPPGQIVRLVNQLRSGNTAVVERALAGLSELNEQHALSTSG
ncbi:SGNH/GDSL hydrolase family protein [Ornithinimicrobium sp. Y1847]|uniref:SGNH/GDSL hydrolase family protein n=1 Tax=Ornithinimicrobium sp. Y1847 TaxID=3405419 RepID=UPI003B675950